MSGLVSSGGFEIGAFVLYPDENALHNLAVARVVEAAPNHLIVEGEVDVTHTALSAATFIPGFTIAWFLVCYGVAALLIVNIFRKIKEYKTGVAMPSTFFALMSRMKYISRWALMRNACGESLSEHSLEAAVLAHCLVVLHNTRFAGNLSPERAATLALFHDMPEVLTGDMPTPVKYHSPQVRTAYEQVEQAACASLIALLPDDLRPSYESLLKPGDLDQPYLPFIKAADKLSALIKCIEEQKAGNCEFSAAYDATSRKLHEMHMPEVECFLQEFLPAYRQPLDGMIGGA